MKIESVNFMGNIIEGGRRLTRKELVSQATNVRVSAGAGQLGQRLELSGPGAPQLKELAQRFGQSGVDAFNEAFITPEFLKGIENRTKILSKGIKNLAYKKDEVSSWMRDHLIGQREALKDFLSRIKGGEEVAIPIRVNLGVYYTWGSELKPPPMDRVVVALKSPFHSPVVQPNP